MCEYPNIDGKSHQVDKTMPLLIELYRAYYLGARLFILFGPQWKRTDTTTIVDVADSLGMKIILVEIREKESKKWRRFKSKNEIYVLNYDADHYVDENILEKHISSMKCVIYDNLSGGPKRLPYWEKILKYDNVVMLLSYIVNRGMMIRDIKDLPNQKTIEYKISPTCCISSMSRFHKEEQIHWTYEKSDDYDYHKGVNDRKRGCHCPDCGQDASRLEPRKNIKPEWHCICEWVGEFDDLDIWDAKKDGNFKSSKDQRRFRKLIIQYKKEHGRISVEKRNEIFRSIFKLKIAA